MANFGTNASGETSCPNFEPVQIMVAQFATDASGAIWWPNLQLMQVAPSCGQICNCCKWLHLVAIFATNASGAILLPSLIQVTESISGSVVPLAMFLAHNVKYKGKKTKFRNQLKTNPKVENA